MTMPAATGPRVDDTLEALTLDRAAAVVQADAVHRRRAPAAKEHAPEHDETDQDGDADQELDASTT